MAKVVGGLHGRPAGSIGGIVYSAARGREGKIVTAREKVNPSNPKTTDQVIQRNKFSQSLFAVRALGASLYSEDFNRAIGQLPGYQSMMSIILNTTNDSFEFGEPPETPLGNLQGLPTFSIDPASGAAGTLTLIWSTELRGDGTDDDTINIFAIAKEDSATNERIATNFGSDSVRSDGTYVLQTDEDDFEWTVGVYVKGAGAAEGKISVCTWNAVTSHA